MSTTTLITGATGFIAGHCIEQLLAADHKVIGTIRSQEKGARLAAAFPEAIKSGQLVFETVSDVRSEKEFTALFQKHQDISTVLHTASPFHFNVEDPVKDMLEPAVDGTLTVLKAIKQHAPKVTKVVITSSFAAMMNWNEVGDASAVVTEKSWNPVSWDEAAQKGNVILTYLASKKFAEKAAWDFLESEKPNFGITTVNPAYVFGPGIAIDAKALNTSNEVIVQGALSTKPGEPAPEGPAQMWVDVRDVAKAHLSAISRDLDNQRLMLCVSKFCNQDLLDVINKEVPALQGKIATGEPGSGAEVDKQGFNFDNEHTRQLLNYNWVSLDKSVADFANQWLSFQK
ncbi:putative NADPH-dependent methylglyoxal reductase GRP2 [Yarrowia sp. B02]|nr:putative NADPH-dependent methylglyoxal reductase GRP2 [Yarrowia sp. B02]